MNRENKLLTVDQAAKYLNDTERYVKWLISTRQIPYVKLTPKKLRIAQADLEAFIEAGRVEAASS